MSRDLSIGRPSRHSEKIEDYDEVIGSVTFSSEPCQQDKQARAEHHSKTEKLAQFKLKMVKMQKIEITERKNFDEKLAAKKVLQ